MHFNGWLRTMNTISYKGYLGTVNFSEKDACFYGKIEGIDGLVNFEGESVSELTQAFHEAVDDYVAYCVAEGIEPHKSFFGASNLTPNPSPIREGSFEQYLFNSSSDS